MPRVAIVEYVMSSGGLERVLRGLARAFLQIPEAQEWDITFLLSRYDTAHRPTRWPEELSGPKLRVEWLGQDGATARALSRLAHFQGGWGTRHLRVAAGLGARALRSSGPRAWRSLAGDPRAALEEASRRFDLLCFVYPFGPPPRALHCPVVTTPQDFNFRHFLPDGSRARRHHEQAMKAWLAASDRVLFTSQAVFTEMQQAFPEAEARSHVVRLGLETDLPTPSASEMDATRAALRLPHEFVLVGGWVMPHKNQLAVVEAMALLRDRGRAVPVVFVGPNASHLADGPVTVRRTPYVVQVRALLARRGMVHGRDYLAPGYVDDLQLRCLHRMASAYLLPSLYEGFGLPSLEALRAGCPTIMSAIPPLEEQNHLLGGIVPMFDPTDIGALERCIGEVLEHPEEARAAARLASQRIPALYDWKKTAAAYLAQFRTVVPTNPAVAGTRG